MLTLVGVGVSSFFERSGRTRRLDPPAWYAVDQNLGMIAPIGFRLENTVSKELEVVQTGAHRTKLRDVVQERAASLLDSGVLAERRAPDAGSTRIPRTEELDIQLQDRTNP